MAFVEYSCPKCGGSGCDYCYGGGTIGSWVDNEREESSNNDDDALLLYGWILRTLRERHRISMVEIARMIDQPVFYVSDIERGKIRPTHDEFSVLTKWIKNHVGDNTATA